MIFVALGSNLPSTFGTPEQTLIAAMHALEEHGVRILDRSTIMKTAPVPVSDQPWFRNAVISVKTDANALDLLAILHKIEKSFGRVRTVKNAPRLLDLDLIAYNDEFIDQDNVTIPHPRLHERSFVLYPLQEIAPNWVHPQLNLSVSQMIKNYLPDSQTLESKVQH